MHFLKCNLRILFGINALKNSRFYYNITSTANDEKCSLNILVAKSKKITERKLLKQLFQPQQLLIFLNYRILCILNNFFAHLKSYEKKSCKIYNCIYVKYLLLFNTICAIFQTKSEFFSKASLSFVSASQTADFNKLCSK